MRQAGEPSVEEILDSIKKVIARDNRGGAADERGQPEEAGMTAIDHSEDNSRDNPLEDDGIFELADETEFTGAEDEFVPEATESGVESPLVTEISRVSMQQSLEALAMLAEPGAKPQIVRSGETSLEGLTRDLLRPVLADWLDRHLPPMVERMVAAEISRIIGKRG